MLQVIFETIYNIILLFYYIAESFVVRWIPVRYRAKDISGQIALVTGAGGGIGRLIAIGLANLGCKVVCWDVAKQGECSQLNKCTYFETVIISKLDYSGVS